MGDICIERLVECETARFSVHGYRGRPDAPEYEFAPGSVPVLISAPHAVTHMRRGVVKPSEDFMGAIALAAAQASGAHALVATRTGEGDPNWDPLEQSAYKQDLCAHIAEQGIRCVLDIHGMVAASEALVAIGSADGATVAPSPGLDERLCSLFTQELGHWCEHFGKPIVLNGRLGARNPNTVACTVARECGVPALQIEVATQLRVPVQLKGRRPKGEPMPFSSSQLSMEIAARMNASPEAVGAFINSLVKAVEMADALTCA